jgi:hypothetical protein
LSHIVAGLQAANPPGNKLQYSRFGLQNQGKEHGTSSLPMVAHPFGGVRNLRRITMKLTAMALAIAVTTVSTAQAGTWTTHWTGPLGGVYEGTGSCDKGTCQSTGTFTGPQGGVWHHSGNAHQVAPGQWAGDRTLVGPGGRTWQNSWTSRSGSTEEH